MTEEPGEKANGASCGCGGSKWIWIGLAAAVLAVLLMKHPPACGYARRAALEKAAPAETLAAGPSIESEAASGAVNEKPLPRLVDLGAHACIPCKMMAPLLDELKKEYAGVFKTEFIDVWKDPEPGRRYGIRVIPTQIFFDAEGKELFRHEGFFGKEDILAKWKELGVDLNQ